MRRILDFFVKLGEWFRDIGTLIIVMLYFMFVYRGEKIPDDWNNETR